MLARLFAAGMLVIAALPGAVAAEGAVTVRFVEPQRYVDAGAYGSGKERMLGALERHLVDLGEQCTEPGQRLELRIVDVDLAGQHEWWRGPAYDLRLMRESTWPRIRIEYVWRDAEGTLLGEGREQVTDMNYLWRSAYVRGDTGPLPYEKAMLRDWMERRFCPRTG